MMGRDRDGGKGRKLLRPLALSPDDERPIFFIGRRRRAAHFLVQLLYERQLRAHVVCTPADNVYCLIDEGAHHVRAPVRAIQSLHHIERILWATHAPRRNHPKRDVHARKSVSQNFDGRFDAAIPLERKGGVELVGDEHEVETFAREDPIEPVPATLEEIILVAQHALARGRSRLGPRRPCLLLAATLR
jgi:hypothetical protein